MLFYYFTLVKIKHINKGKKREKSKCMPQEINTFPRKRRES